MPFRVLIVGGSVAGLGLANMLEKFGIDYLILEAYPEIAPQVGASIGLFSNGLRILDQLGCYEAFRDQVDELYHHGYYRKSDGTIIGYQHDVVELMEKETGYPTVWADRKMLLQVLYDNLQQKHKVLTSKRVVSVDFDGDLARATTEDGASFTGNILVGADGIHSKVRSEMWRLAPPGYFPHDEISQVPVSTKCIFAISERPAEYPAGTQQNLLFKGHSYLCVAAPKNRVFWFLFEGLEKPVYGRDIPRYTNQDAAELVEKYKDDQIAEGIKLKDLYEKRIMTTLVPLQEYVFKKWHYKNIITMGDSAHKVDPITGQGGNGAIESGAILVNALVRCLGENPNGPSQEQLENVLAEVHKYRYERAEVIVNQGHQLQRTVMQMVPFSKFFTHVIMPQLGTLGVLTFGIEFCCSAHRLDGIKLPSRPRALPFDDELPAKPIQVNRKTALEFAGYITILVSAYMLLTRGPLKSGIGLPALAEDNSRAPALAFCANLASLVTVSLLEVNRCGNGLHSLVLITIFVLLNSFMGPGMTAPAFAVIGIFAPHTLFGRFVPLKAAKMVLPITAMFYAIPAAMALSQPTWYTELAWRMAPSLCFLFARAASFNFSLFQDQTPKLQASAYESDKAKYRDKFAKADMPILQMVYTSAFLVSAAAHLAQLISLESLQSLFSCRHCPSLSALGLEKHDSFMLALSCLMLTLGSGPWNLRVKGYISTFQSFKAALCILASSLVLGPGATVAGTSYWRENLMAGLTN